jgi:putative peptidoglycan binding protein
MTCMSRILLFIGAAVSLAACSSQVALPLYPQAMFYTPGAATVKKVQIALRDRGYYASSIDGFIGYNTDLAISRFQVETCQRVKPIVSRSLLVSLGIAGD